MSCNTDFNELIGTTTGWQYIPLCDVWNGGWCVSGNRYDSLHRLDSICIMRVYNIYKLNIFTRTGCRRTGEKHRIFCARATVSHTLSNRHYTTGLQTDTMIWREMLLKLSVQFLTSKFQCFAYDSAANFWPLTPKFLWFERKTAFQCKISEC